MKALPVTDFSGGINEATSPDDFSDNQWSRLKGIIPKNSTTFESQWAAQELGTTLSSTYPVGSYKTTMNQVYPLESSVGTFLVGINTDGDIMWTKLPGPEFSQTAAAAVIWRPAEIMNYQVNTLNLAVPSYPNGNLPQDKIDAPYPYPDKRFITSVPFEVYKYIKSPVEGRNWDTNQDRIIDRTFSVTPPDVLTAPASICPGVLIGCRRAQRGRALGVFTTLSENNYESSTSIPASYQAMVVAYVDPQPELPSWSGNSPLTFNLTTLDWQTSRQGVVRLVSFPHFRRWPTRTQASFGEWPQTTINENGKQVTYSKAAIHRLMSIIRGTTSNPTGVVEEFVGKFPTKTFSEQPAGIRQGEFFHPYTYLDGSSTLLPGRGIIPRANIGTMWNNQLILGDIEWRSDKADAASTAGSLIIPPNTAVVGRLNDETTQPHRGSFYYSEDDIDVFDPRSVIRVTSSNSRIAGMHVIDNRLVCITTAGTELDGVITFSGNLGQIHPYGGAAANPFAVRKQLVRGGVGVADHQDEGAGYSKQTCLWSEAGVAVFIDRLGGVFYTDGQTCDRLDRVGPKQPDISTYRDTVAAVGKHLFVWRQKKLYCFAMLGSNGSMGSGCWTEVVAPPEAYTTDRGIYSMVGGVNQLFMIVNGLVYRYSPASPNKGYIKSNPIDIEIATRTFGNQAAYKKTDWLRVGFSFYTPTKCNLLQVTTRAEAFMQKADQAAGNAIYTPDIIAPSYTVNPANEYQTGHYDFVAPAGIGPQYVMSAEFKFQGHVVLKGFTAWATGDIPSRIEPAPGQNTGWLG